MAIISPPGLPASSAGAGLVRATGAARSRSLADRFADVVSVKDERLVPDADDTASFTRAIARLLSSPLGGVLDVPHGDYFLASAIPVALGPAQRIVIRGVGGTHGAKIHFTNAASVGINITMAPTAQWLPYGPSVSVSDITFVADYASVAGTALSVTQSDPGAGTYARNPYPSVNIRNITWQGSGPNNGFLGGASLFGTALTQVENTYFWAANGDSSSVMLAYDTDTAIPVVVDHFISNPRMHGGGTAIKVGNASTTNSLEGFDVVRPSFTGCVNGIVAQNITGGFNVSGGQINTTAAGISYLGGVTGGLFISNVDFIMAGPTHVNVNGAATVTITGSNFLSSGGTAQQAIVLNNIPSTASNGGQINGNTFRNFANAPIALTGTTDYVHMSGNINRASATLYTDTTGKGHNTSFANSIGGAIQPFAVGQPGLAQTAASFNMYSSGNAVADVTVSVSGGNATANQGTYNVTGGLMDVSASFKAEFEIVFGNVVYVTAPATTATVPSFRSQWVYAPGSTTATLAVTLPSFARDGLMLELMFANPVTSLTVSPNGGQSIVGAAISAAAIGASTTVKYYYRSSNTTWYRAQ